MKITEHAKGRIKKRCGLPKKALERNAKTAFDEGVKHSECTGRLRKYCDYLFLSHRHVNSANNIRFYGNHVYIFMDEKLITVLPLPNIYRDALKKANQRRSKKGVASGTSQEPPHEE